MTTADEARPLTADEVADLPEGTPITVRWSGGNGPHDYVIAVDHNGERYAAGLDDPFGALRFYNPLSFVGQESYHTQVVRR